MVKRIIPPFPDGFDITLIFCRLASAERDGLVTVNPEPENKRIRLVRLTPKGLEKLKESTPSVAGRPGQVRECFRCGGGEGPAGRPQRDRPHELLEGQHAAPPLQNFQ